MNHIIIRVQSTQPILHPSSTTNGVSVAAEQPLVPFLKLKCRR